MALPNTAYNLATGNKWILTIPFHQLNDKLNTNTVAFNLFNFSIPELTIGEADFTGQGVSFPIPTFVRNESKSITFNYMLSSDWHQFKTLYSWFQLIANEKGGASTNNANDYSLDVTVTMISEYKNERFDVVFHGAWAQSLEAIDLNYQNGDANITHSFTLRYAYYTIENLIEKED